MFCDLEKFLPLNGIQGQWFLQSLNLHCHATVTLSAPLDTRLGKDETPVTDFFFYFRVLMPDRKSSEKVEFRGPFPGATVVRSVEDFVFGDQDGIYFNLS